MIYYAEDSVISRASPHLFGNNSFFDVHTTQRPLRKAKQFRIRVFSARIGPSPNGRGFKVEPKGLGMIFLEAEENLLQRGFELAVEEANIIDPDEPVYLTIPHFFQFIYGHWIVDILPALLVARRLLNGLDIRLLHAGAIPEFGRSLLREAGVSDASLVDIASIDVVAQHQLISMTPIREHDYFFGGLLKAHFVSTIHSIITNRPVSSDPVRRIYISRRDWRAITPDSRALVNRDEVEDIFRSAGYEIISPEKMSIAEQIKVFSEAGVMAGESGSGLHNSIYMRPKGHTICIQSGRQTHVIQASLCDIFGQTCSYVIGQQDNADWNANFVANISDIQHAIEAVA